MKVLKKLKGFTLVELLVVLVIVGILVAIATPLYIQHTRRARMSEAVATAGLIRQALRDFRVNQNTYFSIAIDSSANGGNIQNGLPTSVSTTFVPTPATAGVEVDAGVAQYFSNRSYHVLANAPQNGTGATNANAITQTGGTYLFLNPQHPTDFLIKVNGANSEACDNTGGNSANCAIRSTEVANYRLEMDNAGRIFVSYDAGATWGAY